MKRALTLIVLLSACAGQSAVPVWVNPGTLALTAEQDFLSCAARAERDFPPARSRSTIGVSVGTGFCTGAFCLGGSRRVGGIDNRREARNDSLRARAVNVCMQRLGYSETSLPACPSGSVTVLQSQPFDTRGLCVVEGKIAAR